MRGQSIAPPIRPRVRRSARTPPLVAVVQRADAPAARADPAVAGARVRSLTRRIASQRATSVPSRPLSLARVGLSGSRLRLARRQHVPRPFGPLPCRNRWLAAIAGDVLRTLDQLHPMDVARAVREDLA